MTICIFGDSIAWGASDYEKGGWADRLKNYLMTEDIDVYNLGISGDTTEELLKRFAVETEARKPDIIIFAIGINDSLSIKENKPVNLEKFRNNLASLTDKAKQFTDKIIFIGLTNVDETKTNPYFPSETGKSYNNQSIGEYDEAIRSFCEDNDLMFIEMLGLLINDDDLCDGLHPSSIGHQKMFGIIKNAIESIWRE
ncbi:MAG TPA: GDSL-type esterase/lipase family protein [Candidatus Pacearchaeota archaeon]|nr:GDSL-type esterase/lipase family protein [Candidatus Pacearchaeota archaeon]HPR79880.1 GDSL-type esterase/lipase family protein [Candidatus Pacearchaeota archaeon]